MAAVMYVAGCIAASALLLVAVIVVHAVRCGWRDRNFYDEQLLDELTREGWETRAHTMRRYDEVKT